MEKLSDLLFRQLKDVCINLEKALIHDTDRLKVEHDEFYNRVIPELDKLKVDLLIKRPPDMTRPAQYQTPVFRISIRAIQSGVNVFWLR